MTSLFLFHAYQHCFLLFSSFHSGFIPFTFGKNNKDDKRRGAAKQQNKEFIPADSFKTVHQKTALHNLGKKSGEPSRAITCLAYANGISSSVALLLSSREHKIEWDLILADPSTSERYSQYREIKNLPESRPRVIEKGKRFMDGFALLEGKGEDYESILHARAKQLSSDEDEEMEQTSSDEDEETDRRVQPEVLIGQGVEPLTWVQLCQAWWICRSLSLSSSTVDKLIVAAAPFIDHDHPMRQHFERILRYVGRDSLLPTQAAGVHSDDDEDMDTSAPDNGGQDADEAESVARSTFSVNDNSVAQLLGEEEEEDDLDEHAEGLFDNSPAADVG